MAGAAATGFVICAFVGAITGAAWVLLLACACLLAAMWLAGGFA